MTSDNNIIKVDFKSKPSDDPVLLLDNVDVAFALWACNMFGVQYIDIDDLEYNVLSVEDLYTFKPTFIRECLKQALQSQLLSSCLLYTSPSPRDRTRSRMPSSA